MLDPLAGSEASLKEISKSTLEGGDYYFRLAFKAKNAASFRKQMRKAIAAYEAAAEAPKRNATLEGRSEQARAAAFFAESYLAPDSPSRKRALEMGVHAARRSLESFEDGHARSETARAILALIILLAALFNLEWAIDKRIAIVKESLTHTQKAIALFTRLQSKVGLAWALYYSSIHSANAASLFETAERREHARLDSVRYARRALQLSRKLSADLLCSKANLLVLSRLSYTRTPLTVSHPYLREAFARATRTRNNEAIGDTLLAKSTSIAWGIDVVKDANRKGKYFKESRILATNAAERYSHILNLEGMSGADTCLSHLLYHSALVQVDLEKRQQLLEKAAKIGQEALNYYRMSGAVSTYGAEDLGPPSLILSRIFHQLAQLAENPEKKRELLKESLRHGEEISRLLEVKEPHHSWNRGVSLYQSALIEEELSKVNAERNQKISHLEEAAKKAEEALRLCKKYYEPAMAIPKHINIWFGIHGGKLCSILEQLSKLTGNMEYQRRLLAASKETVIFFRDGGLPSGAAETHWRLGKAFDQLGRHDESAEEFGLAASDYDSAARKMPRAREFFSDFALYMRSWSKIEEGKYHHGRQDYAMAKDAYEKAAAFHRSSKRWSYLSENYAAWAEVEHAEELSRKNNSAEAIQAFEMAVKLLKESRVMIRSNLAKIEGQDEREMATELSTGTELRGEYCEARIRLEEAKRLENQGEYSLADEAFGQAAETFERIAGALDSDSEKMELKLIAVLAKAWQAMTRAEAEAGPEHYGAASKLFEEARTLGQNETTRILCLGHSRFCKALESGTRFVDTRDPALHITAVQQLESAADYYLRAGFENSAENAKATRLLFDAYAYMDDANRERENQKKIKLYALAEEVLRASAETFVKAEQPRKETEVLKLLGRVQKEEALAKSMTKVLEVSGALSSTTAFTTPSPTKETAVGLEGFEHANVQVRVKTRRNLLKLGETFDLEMELVNAGRGSAQLVRIEELLSQGFVLIEGPEGVSAEGADLSMSGRRLASLKTEDFKLLLQPRARGHFRLRPRIVYLDDGGQIRSVEPEPVELTVGELGISGWLKGKLPG